MKILSITSLFICLSISCLAHLEKNQYERWINVTGHGEVSASPDLAILRLGVLTTAKSAKLSTELNNQAILRIFEVLKQKGISQDDYETERFQLSPQRQYRKGLPPLITGYQVSNFLVIQIRDLDRVGEIMQSTIDAGGNNFESLTFRVEDDQEYLEQARVQAMEDALEKAETLAGTLNSIVGPPITIQEAAGHYRPMQERRMMQADAMMAESVPIQGPSELSTRVQVQVKFALE